MDPSFPESLISDVHAQCFVSFVALIDAIDNPVRDFRDQSPFILNHVQESFDKYKIWAGNVGAAHAGKRYQISLDYRLREASFYKAQIQKALSLVQGTRRPFEDLLFTDPDPQSNPAVLSEDSSDQQNESDDSPWEISASSDDNDDDDEPSPKKQSKASDKCDEFYTTQENSAKDQQPRQAISLVQKPTLEMPNLVESIDFVVVCLYKIPIRRPAPLDRLKQKTSVEASFYQHFDILYVKDKFPQLESDVATRLGKMITRRRQLLFYRFSHEQKLEATEVKSKVALIPPSATGPLSLEHHSGPEAISGAAVGEIARSQVPSTQITQDTYATTLHNIAFQLEHTGVLYPPSTPESKSSMASSYACENMRVEVPPRPKAKDGKELECFECPFCLITQFINSKHTWKKHVLGDLQPYVCTYSGCDQSDQFFENREVWYKHETQWHRTEWFCNVDPHPHYAEQTDFLAHMKSDHNTTFDASQSSLLSSMFRCPSQSLQGICNLCGKPSKSLKSHVSRHLEQVALFALPRINEVAENETGIAKDSVNEENSQHKFTKFKYNHPDSQNERSSSNDIFEQQSQGSDLDHNLHQDIVPDSRDPFWDMFTDKFSEAREELHPQHSRKARASTGCEVSRPMKGITSGETSQKSTPPLSPMANTTAVDPPAKKPKPYLSYEDAKQIREGRGVLIQQQQELLKDLKDRDHVFLMDDSISMKAYWEDVISLFSVFAYFAKRLDNNGLEMYFTVSVDKETFKNTTPAVSRLKRMRHERGTYPNFNHRLDQILRRYRADLDRQKDRAKGYFRLTAKAVKPLSLYVFTDAAWPGCDAVAPIEAMIEKLKQLYLPKEQVAIQFIRFGNDPIGIERLVYLDSGLREKYTKRWDIVDTEPFQGGNLLKMLLGAMSEWFDDDEPDGDY